MRLLLLAAVLAACGGKAADTVHIAATSIPGLLLDCDPTTATPACPPSDCTVDETGAVTGCTTDSCDPTGPQPEDCSADALGTCPRLVWRHPDAITKLCAPAYCEFKAQNVRATCGPDVCDAFVTRMLVDFGCP